MRIQEVMNYSLHIMAITMHALHMNSTIYINGAIQVRNIRKRHLTCDYCHEAFTRPDTAVEIIPYNIEYIDDCIIPDTENTKGDEIDE